LNVNEEGRTLTPPTGVDFGEGFLEALTSCMFGECTLGCTLFCWFVLAVREFSSFLDVSVDRGLGSWALFDVKVSGDEIWETLFGMLGEGMMMTERAGVETLTKGMYVAALVDVGLLGASRLEFFRIVTCW
jgi:hypothetical protein